MPYFWRRASLGSRWRSILQKLALATAALLTLFFVWNTDLVRAAGVDCWPYAVDPDTETREHSFSEVVRDPCLLLERVGDHTARLRGWRTTADHLGSWVEAAAEESGGEIFAIANRYQSATALNFYLADSLPLIQPSPRHPRVHTTESPVIEHQFSFWPSYAHVESVEEVPTEDGDTLRVERSPFMGKAALYVSDDPIRWSPPDRIKNTFAEWHLVDIVNVLRRGHLVRTIKIFACYGYSGSDL